MPQCHQSVMWLKKCSEKTCAHFSWNYLHQKINIFFYDFSPIKIGLNQGSSQKLFGCKNNSHTVPKIKHAFFSGLSQRIYIQNYKAKVDHVFKLELFKVK